MSQNDPDPRFVIRFLDADDEREDYLFWTYPEFGDDELNFCVHAEGIQAFQATAALYGAWLMGNIKNRRPVGSIPFAVDISYQDIGGSVATTLYGCWPVAVSDPAGVVDGQVLVTSDNRVTVTVWAQGFDEARRKGRRVLLDTLGAFCCKT